MPHPERLVREEFQTQMAARQIGGVPAGMLVGCVYMLLDTDSRPLYVGQSTGTGERLAQRISRHVLGQRSDAANKVFPPFEARYVRIWSMRPPGVVMKLSKAESDAVTAAERHLLWISQPPSDPPLNERIPAKAPPSVTLPPHVDVDYWGTLPADVLAQLTDIDARIDRWAESIRRLADRIKHSGSSLHLKRVQKLQVARLYSLL